MGSCARATLVVTIIGLIAASVTLCVLYIKPSTIQSQLNSLKPIAPISSSGLSTQDGKAKPMLKAKVCAKADHGPASTASFKAQSTPYEASPLLTPKTVKDGDLIIMKLCAEGDPFVQAAMSRSAGHGRRLQAADVTAKDLMGVLHTAQAQNGWLDAAANKDLLPVGGLSTADDSGENILGQMSDKISSMFYAAHSRTMLIRLKDPKDLKATLEKLRASTSACIQFAEQDKVGIFATSGLPEARNYRRAAQWDREPQVNSFWGSDSDASSQDSYASQSQDSNAWRAESQDPVWASSSQDDPWASSSQGASSQDTQGSWGSDASSSQARSSQGFDGYSGSSQEVSQPYQPHTQAQSYTSQDDTWDTQPQAQEWGSQQRAGSFDAQATASGNPSGFIHEGQGQSVGASPQPTEVASSLPAEGASSKGQGASSQGQGASSSSEASSQAADSKARVTNDQLLDQQWALKYIGAKQAWEKTHGDREVVVAVLDTGVDIYHPELRSRLFVNKLEMEGLPGVDDDNNGYIDDAVGWDFHDNTNNPMDSNAHGTHCAGVIGAIANNSIGMAGVAAVSIMPLRVMGTDGSGRYSSFVQAIEYARRNGATILSNSYGGPDDDASLKEQVKMATDAGLLYVVAAGNEGTDLDATKAYPASWALPNMLTVAASDERECMAAFSNYGKNTVHLAAPGVSIISTVPTEFKYKRHGTDYDTFAPMDGTSMATPYVAGAAALVVSALKAQGKPWQGQAAFVKQVLLDSVDKYDNYKDYTITGGRLDVAKAIQLAYERSP